MKVSRDYRSEECQLMSTAVGSNDLKLTVEGGEVEDCFGRKFTACNCSM